MIQSLWRSCYDFRFLLASREARLGQALAYLLGLGALLAAARVVVAGPMLLGMIERGSDYVDRELPEIRIENGVATVDAVQPWVRSFDGQFQLVLDTTGQTAEVDPAHPTGLLVQKDRVLYKQGPGAVRALEFKEIESFSTRGPKMRQLVEDLRRWVYPVAAPVLAATTALGLSLRWLVGAGLGTLFARAVGSPLGWNELVRVSAFAATPAVYLLLLGTLTPLSVALVPTLAHLFFLGMPVWLSREPGSPAEEMEEPESPSEDEEP